MFTEPSYAQNIIVGVLFQGLFRWYVTEKAYWYLDYQKYDALLVALGRSPSASEDQYAHRCGIAILNEETAQAFLLQIEDKRVSAHLLSQMMGERNKRRNAKKGPRWRNYGGSRSMARG